MKIVSVVLAIMLLSAAATSANNNTLTNVIKTINCEEVLQQNVIELIMNGRDTRYKLEDRIITEYIRGKGEKTLKRIIAEHCSSLHKQ
jgi:uncharacterized lipoprotein YajG